MHSISFQTFFVQAFKIVVDSWKFNMLLLYILLYIMLCQTNFYDFRFKWTATAAIGIYPIKPDGHCWWISKTQWGHLEERYKIKLCFKLGKKATETYEMLQTALGKTCMNRASVFEWHKRFKEGRGSVRDDERCGRSKEANTPELIGQRVWVRVTMLKF